MTEPIDPNGLPGYPAYPAPWTTPTTEALPVYPPFGAPPPEAAPPPPPPPSHRGRNALIVVLSTLVFAAACVGAYAVFRTVGRSAIAMPATFDGYYRLNNQSTSREESAMRSLFNSTGALRAATSSASFGFYSRNSGDQPELIAVAFPTSTVGKPSLDLATQLQISGGVSVRTYPPGPHGGESACGLMTYGSVTEVQCAWTDRRTGGVLVSVFEQMTPERLARLERHLRDRIE